MVRVFRYAWWPAVLLALWAFSSTALAHKEVQTGSYVLTIGWVKEPVVAGERNGLDLFVSRADTRPGENNHDTTGAVTSAGEHDHDEAGAMADASGSTAEPDQPQAVTNAAETLKFAVEYGDVQQSYTLRPVFGEPGHYTADIIPTRAGRYTFHFTGDINGEPVDVRFEPEEVVGTDQLAFPQPAPSTLELAVQMAVVQEQVRTAQGIALAGAALGLLGAVLGAYALLRKR